jgi:diguanylate cyclase (GGDEF)-like protein
MFNRFFNQYRIDLRDMEGDYRAFNLQSDKAQAILSLLVTSFSILIMLRVDRLLFAGRDDLFRIMVLCRVVYILFTALFMIAIIRTNRVKTFDRLVLGWLSSLILILLLYNFTRPTNYLTTVFDIIVVLAMYMLSPLNLRTNILLAFVFSIGTMYVNHFLKTAVDPIELNVATAAQFITHALGIGACIQLHSFRRTSFRAYMTEKDARETAAYLANIDPLTRSFTRRQFLSLTGVEFNRFKRYKRPLSIVSLDVDSFKSVNDTYGHHAGDLVLRSFSLMVMEQKRIQDTFGRLGGEEFGLLMPETTIEQARLVAERIRARWEDSPTNLDGELIRSTISIGIAEASLSDNTFDDMFRRADRMLYKAKDAGRNQVMTE